MARKDGTIPTVVLNDVTYQVEEFRNVMFIPPEKISIPKGSTLLYEADEVLTAVFMNKENIPTHAANWTKQTAQQIILALSEIVKGMK